MKTQTKAVKIVPSRRVFSAVESLSKKGRENLLWFCEGRDRPENGRGLRLCHLWIAFSAELDSAFTRRFRREAASDTRLLVLNEGCSSDTLASRITDLQIRSPHRFYVADLHWGSGKTMAGGLLLQRLVSALESKDSQDRVLDATIENETLRVVSPDFRRLEIPIFRIPALARAKPSATARFEIDKDGSYVYWPDLDLHLGWEQLQQIVDPEAARRAHQHSHEFNVRYGQTVRRVREQAGLGRSDILGISEKQLRRIENGECRLTSNAAQVLQRLTS